MGQPPACAEFSPNALHFVQADTYGLYRDVKINWSPAQPTTLDGDAEVVLRDGKRIVVRNPTVTVLPDNIGYRVKFNFFIPPASLPADFKPAAKAADSSVFGYSARLISDALSVGVLALKVTASAAHSNQPRQPPPRTRHMTRCWRRTKRWGRRKRC